MKPSVNVLFIDDEQAFLDVLVKRLQKRGFNTWTAGSAGQGLVLLKQHPVDLVVLDLCMPGLDGLETLGIIKTQHPRTEVILLTGHACMRSARQCMDLGAFDYLMKPVDIDELVYRLEDAYYKVIVSTRKSLNC